MAKLNVIWTRTADLQFVGILEYWVKRNKSNRYSIKLLKLVSERTNQIAKTPFIYKLTDFEDFRVASLGNHSIYYKALEKWFNNLCILGQSTRSKKLLKILQCGK